MNHEILADYLAEKPPFLQLPRHPFTRTGDTLTIPLGRAYEFSAANFTDLMLQTGTMGALNLALSQPAMTGRYIMMEQMRIARYGQWDPAALLHAAISSRLLSDRKGCAVAHIRNEQQEVIYSMRTGYHVFTRPDFERLFAACKQEDPPDMEQDPVLPSVQRLPSGNPDAFRLRFGPFTQQHCAGHFPGYPCVPASFVMRCLLAGIMPPQQVIDNVEIFTARMIPTGITLCAATTVLHTSRRSCKFIVNLEDAKDPAVTYGHYIIDTCYSIHH